MRSNVPETLFSIITPTFNRELSLIDLAESINRQDFKSLEWIIVDDGSLDQTKQIVDDLKRKTKINIVYLYKENGGKHTALNVGLQVAIGKYALIVDSDDVLIEGAIKTMSNLWVKHEHETNIACISTLCVDGNGQIIGDEFPGDNYRLKNFDLFDTIEIAGDKFESYKLSILKQYPFPEFSHEKFLTEAVVWNRISKKYLKVGYNIKTLIHIYRYDGLTAKISKLHKMSPIGSELFFYELALECSFWNKIRYSGLAYRYRIYAPVKINYDYNFASKVLGILHYLLDRMRECTVNRYK